MSGYKHVLCATDFSLNSDRACERAWELAQCFTADLTLLHVVEYFPEDRSNRTIAPEDIDPVEYRQQQAEQQMAQQIERVGCGDANTRIIFSTRSARHEVVPYAKANGVDLVVLSSHGRHGMHALLGSSAAGVLHQAECDVLAVRAKED